MTVTFDIIGKTPTIVTEEAILAAIREEFSVVNEAKEFTRDPAKKKFIPGRLYAITPTGKFKLGLAFEIIKVVVSKQLASSIKMTPAFLKQFKRPYGKTDAYNNLTHSLRYYQEQSVEACLKRGYGLCILGTGAGKTLLTASLISSIFNQRTGSIFKCLFVVPTPDLARQSYNDFLEYKVPFKVSVWTGKDELDLTSDVIICSHKNLLSRIQDNDWVYLVDLLVVDEVHTIKKGNKITDIVNKIKTPNRYGFTGTLPDNQLDRWDIFGMFGEILYVKDSASLRQENFLTKAHTRFIHIDYKKKYIKVADDLLTNKSGNKLSVGKYLSEMREIYNNDYRNKVIVNICEKFTKNILIIVNHIEQGENIEKALRKINKKVYFVRGSMSMDDRGEVKRIMERENDVVVVAMSKIFSTGINVKNIHMIMFAACGKSTIRLVQSIGRGLRLHNDKKILHIIDIVDSFEYAEKHYQARLSIYEKEQIPFSHINLREL